MVRRFWFRLKQAWPLSDPLCRSSRSKRFSDAVNFIHSLPCKITAYQDLGPDPGAPTTRMWIFLKTEMFASPRENAETMEIRQHLSQSLRHARST